MTMKVPQSENVGQEIVVYSGLDVELALPLDRVRETVWASSAQIEELFAIDQSGVSRHIRKIRKAICKKCILLPLTAL
jgi:hypothetical protein